MNLIDYRFNRFIKQNAFCLIIVLTGCQVSMKQATPFCMVLTTCPNQQEADTHAKAIIEKHLGACVQSHPVHSHYLWEGKVQSDPEVLLRIKTTRDNYDALEHYLKTAHSYDVPQIIQVPITNGLPEYLEWVREETAVSGQ